jgi:hypothetical protein
VALSATTRCVHPLCSSRLYTPPPCERGASTYGEPPLGGSAGPYSTVEVNPETNSVAGVAGAVWSCTCSVTSCINARSPFNSPVTHTVTPSREVAVIVVRSACTLSVEQLVRSRALGESRLHVWQHTSQASLPRRDGSVGSEPAGRGGAHGHAEHGARNAGHARAAAAHQPWAAAVPHAGQPRHAAAPGTSAAAVPRALVRARVLLAPLSRHLNPKMAAPGSSKPPGTTAVLLCRTARSFCGLLHPSDPKCENAIERAETLTWQRLEFFLTAVVS